MSGFTHQLWSRGREMPKGEFWWTLRQEEILNYFAFKLMPKLEEYLQKAMIVNK